MAAKQAAAIELPAQHSSGQPGPAQHSSALPGPAQPAPAQPSAAQPASAADDGRQRGLAEVIAVQEAIFMRRQPESRLLADRAAGALTGGVTSSWQITRPQPVWLSHGKGSRVYDVDGNEYVD